MVNPTELEKKGSISKRTFNALYQEIMDRVEAVLLSDKIKANYKKNHWRYPIKGQSAELFGFGQYDYHTPKNRGRISVASIIDEDDRVKLFLKSLDTYGEKPDKYNFGKTLYNLKKKFDKLEADEGEIEISRKVNLYVFFIFLGYDDKNDFEQKNGFLESASTTALPAQIAQKKDGSYQYYAGFYYSITKYNIKKFGLAIDFENGQAKEWGFHMIDPEDEDVECQGRIVLRDNSLFLNLEEEGSKLQLNIIAHVDRTNVKKQKIIRGTLQAVSTKGYPLSVEVFLVKTERQFVIPIDHSTSEFRGLVTEENRFIAFYLMMQRRNYYISREIFENFESIRLNARILC